MGARPAARGLGAVRGRAELQVGLQPGPGGGAGPGRQQEGLQDAVQGGLRGTRGVPRYSIYFLFIYRNVFSIIHVGAARGYDEELLGGFLARSRQQSLDRRGGGDKQEKEREASTKEKEREASTKEAAKVSDKEAEADKPPTEKKGKKPPAAPRRKRDK